MQNVIAKEPRNVLLLHYVSISFTLYMTLSTLNVQDINNV